MAAIINGKLTYARHMKGTSAKGEYNFFSLVLLDGDTGTKYPVQVGDKHKQFAELVAAEATLEDREAIITLGSYSSGHRKDKQPDGTIKEVPTTRFFAKNIKILVPATSGS
jgi:hypothetical protein